MRQYQLAAFGLDNLSARTVDKPASPGTGQIAIDVRALSLNFRDLMVIQGHYNPRLRLPATPISDGAGVVAAVGDSVERLRVGDRVVTHFVSDWIDGPFQGAYTGSTLGTPGPGLAAERVLLPAQAVLPIPDGYDFAEAATLPIAALTAWSAIVTEGNVQPGQSVLTLGTGGVSIFAVQLAKALGARVLITSSSDEKLARARELGADVTINYRENPDWERLVLEATDGRGVDVTVETGGAGTLNQSLKATRAGGAIGMLGALTGLKAEIHVGAILMKRLRVCGIMVDSRASFEQMNAFLGRHAIRPVIDRRFPFDELPEALRTMQRGEHFGKIAIDVA